MKTGSFVLIQTLVFAVLILTGSFATGQDEYNVKENEELIGTWINKYRDGDSKLTIKHDGTWNEYKRWYDDKPTTCAAYIINEKWTDSAGNTFYKSIVTDTELGTVYYILSRINKALTVYEDMWSASNMALEFDPNNLHFRYRIYYRQE